MEGRCLRRWERGFGVLAALIEVRSKDGGKKQGGREITTSEKEEKNE